MWSKHPRNVDVRADAIGIGCLMACLLFALPAYSTEIARWSFEDGTADDSIGSYDLTAISGGPTISGGIALFDGDEGTPSYLETVGYGGAANWTVSILVQASGPFDQGNFQGILSNNNSSSASNSWQIESHGGFYQFRTRNSGVHVIGAPTGGFDSIVVRKIGGSDGDIWFNGIQVVSSIGTNPGGLQNFRVGTNRNSNNFYAFGVDSLRIFDSVEDPLLVPEPGTAILLGVGLMSLAVRRDQPSRFVR